MRTLVAPLALVLLAAPAARAQAPSSPAAATPVAPGATLRVSAPRLREFSLDARPLPTTWIGAYVRSDSLSLVLGTARGERGIPWDFVRRVEVATAGRSRARTTLRTAAIGGAGTAALFYLVTLAPRPMFNTPAENASDDRRRLQAAAVGGAVGVTLGALWGLRGGPTTWTRVDRAAFAGP